MSKQQASPATSAESSVPAQKPAGSEHTSVGNGTRTPDRYSTRDTSSKVDPETESEPTTLGDAGQSPSGHANAGAAPIVAGAGSEGSLSESNPGGFAQPMTTPDSAAILPGQPIHSAPSPNDPHHRLGEAGAPGNFGMPAAYGPGSITAGINKSQVAEAVRAARQSVTAAASRNARRNRLQLRKIDPWSVMKFSFAASLVLFITFVVSTAVLYTVLDAMGVFDSVNETVRSLTTTTDEGGEDASFIIDAKTVIGGAALLGAVNMVLFTALATLGAFIYNVCADLAGGIEVTLSERD